MHEEAPTDPVIAEALAREPSATQVRIAEAAVRVIAERGFDVVSVRVVAEASGLSAGTVQYHFRTRQELLVGALLHSLRRQTERVEAAVTAARETGGQTVRSTLAVALRELLPLEGERHEDAAAWVAFGAAASTRDWLAGLYWGGVVMFRERIREVLAGAATAGSLREGLTPETATPLVTALVNGLTLDLLNAPAAEHTRAEEALDRGLGLVLTD